MLNLPIYFDYAATTPVDKRIVNSICSCLSLDGSFGNPASSTHSFGWVAKELVEKARENIARLVNADKKEIIFTSGATEADNLAIKGVAREKARLENKKHIITSAFEHKAVLDACKFLESNGFRVSYIKPDINGIINPNDIKDAICDDTALISVMHVNNEIGTIQDIMEIGKIAKKYKVVFHVDAAQAAGKVKIDLAKLDVDLMSFSSHKIYGPKGIGALYVRSKSNLKIESQMHGGGHERKLRSGTLPTHQIVGMGEAFRLADIEIDSDNKRLVDLRKLFWNGLKDIEEIRLNSPIDGSAPNIINISFNYIEGESLIMKMHDLAVSSGSACTSASLKPSYVLKSLGLSDELAHSSIRFSFGRFTTKEEIEYAVKIIKKTVKELRKLSPLWDMYKSGINLDSLDWEEDDHAV